MWPVPVWRGGGECGGHWPHPSLEGKGADVRVLSVGAMPVSLEVPTQNEGVVWERVLEFRERVTRTCVCLCLLREVAGNDCRFGPRV